MRTVVRAAAVWLPIAVAVTGLALLAYGSVQQALRQAANDPQIEMAEEAAAQLEAGAEPSSLAGSASNVELERSLAPFLMVFGPWGDPVATAAVLHGQPASAAFPASVFGQVRSRGGQERLTWQPEPGVRSAVVVQAWSGGFVVAGRSLRLVEERERQTLLLALAAWGVTLVGTAAAALVGARV
jgi:hypothetical protein